MSNSEGDSDKTISDHALYGEWDAAYVLGSLSPVERREFEAHLETCGRCAASVAELAALPGLLSRVDGTHAFSLLDETEGETGPQVTGPAPGIVARVIHLDRRRRRRTRLVVGLAAAAVLVAATAITVPLAVQNAAQKPRIEIALAATTSEPVTADVLLREVGWGTKIEMACEYADSGDPALDGVTWDYALWVVDRAGHESQLSSWTATAGKTVNISAGTALKPSDIDAVEIRSLTTGDVVAQSAAPGD